VAQTEVLLLVVKPDNGVNTYQAIVKDSGKKIAANGGANYPNEILNVLF